MGSGTKVVALCCALVLMLSGVAMAGPGSTIMLPQASVSVPADIWESDNTSTTASVLPKTSYHTLSSYADTDWMKFSVAETDTPFIFETQITEGNDSFDLYMYLYKLEDDGSLTQLRSEDDHGYWQAYSSFIQWEAPEPGTYFLEVSGIGDGETGMYTLCWDQGFARRVAGVDRYKTSVEVSKLMYQMYDVYFDYGFYTSGVVITSGSSPADALAGGLLAAAVDGPMLLSGPTGLSSDVKAEISRVIRPIVYYEGEPVTIYILGGTGAVPSAVESQLLALPEVAAGIEEGNLEIVRLAGLNRYETAALVAGAVDDVIGVSGTAYVVGGTAWADGVAVGAPSAYMGSPVLLTAQHMLSSETSQAISDLGITSAYIVGGESVVSADVEDELISILGEPNVGRLFGDSRYATALAVAEHGVSLGLAPDRVILVSGEDWPDALVAAPMVYQWTDAEGVYGPVLLTTSTALAPEVTQFVEDQGQPRSLCYVVGGTSVVSDAVLNQFTALRALGPR
ncbi:MAG: cell wall-binding repeat-containing protein [Coriobacteriia bacterium]